jgi:phosphopantetheinyl transferase (holo-ACP synthase)
MKTKFLIIAFLLFTLLGAFALKANAQDSTLIADETTLTYTKTGAKIVSFSEAAFKAISLKWGDEFKSINIKYKTDRYGKYKEYVIYMSQELANNIRQWAKKNL